MYSLLVLTKIEIEYKQLQTVTTKAILFYNLLDGYFNLQRIFYIKVSKL